MNLFFFNIDLTKDFLAVVVVVVGDIDNVLFKTNTTQVTSVHHLISVKVGTPLVLTFPAP